MPKYYFNIRDHDGIVPDEEGMELPDIDAARHEATESARELLADVIRGHRKVDARRIELTDTSGEVLETVCFRDLLD